MLHICLLAVAAELPETPPDRGDIADQGNNGKIRIAPSVIPVQPEGGTRQEFNEGGEKLGEHRMFMLIYSLHYTQGIGCFLTSIFS